MLTARKCIKCRIKRLQPVRLHSNGPEKILRPGKPAGRGISPGRVLQRNQPHRLLPPQQHISSKIMKMQLQSSPLLRKPLLLPHPPHKNKRMMIHNQELLPPQVSTPHPQSLLQQLVAAKSLISVPPEFCFCFILCRILQM